MPRLLRNSTVGDFRARRRQGVILLVILSMLALFTMIALTFVVAAGNFRRGAVAANRMEQLGDPPAALLNNAILQVIRGSRNPLSSVGPHSLLEDIYGHADSVYGMVECQLGANNRLDGVQARPPRFHPTSNQQFLQIHCLTFGLDRRPGRAFIDDNNDGVVDDPAEYFSGQGDDAPLGRYPRHAPIDGIDNYYAGRVITFISGSCAGQSTYIAQSRYNPAQPTIPAQLWLLPFESGTVPGPGDRYIINGRAFNGSGIGASPRTAATGLLDLKLGDFEANTGLMAAETRAWNSHVMPNQNLSEAVWRNFELALLPNPANAAYQYHLNDGAGRHVSANEDYDAADIQNMAMCQQVWNPIDQAWDVIAPSFHRPALVNYWLNRGKAEGWIPSNGIWSDIPAELRRRIILRPDPSDHFDVEQQLSRGGPWRAGEPYDDTNQNGQWDPGENYDDLNNSNFYDPPDPSFANPNFDPINGPWDVDADNSGTPDSIWMDIGLPVQLMGDGRLAKPLFAIKVLDLDGRLNINAHGSIAHNEYMESPPESNPANFTYAPLGVGVFDRYRLGSDSYFRYRRSSTSIPTIRHRDIPYGPVAGWHGVMHYSNAAGYGSVTIRNLMEFCKPLVGQGYSPADINLGFILTDPYSGNVADPAAHINRYRWILQGRWQWGSRRLPIANVATTHPLRFPPPMPGRYGHAHLLPNPHDPSTLGKEPFPGPQAGITHQVDPSNGNLLVNGDDNSPPAPSFRLAGNTPDQFRGNYFRDTFNLTDPDTGRVAGVYGTPSDFFGKGYVALDLTGQPIFGRMGSRELTLYDSGTPQKVVMPDTIDEPTEINLLANRAGGGSAGMPGRTLEIDAPFGPTELESLLRAHDIDAQELSYRMGQLVYHHRRNIFRNRITTESWDVPIPHIAPTPEMRATLVQLGLPITNVSILDLLRAKVAQVNGLTALTDVDSLVWQSTRQAPQAPLPAAEPVWPLTAASNNDLKPQVRTTNRYHGRLLHPDLLVGVRIDLNAPFGNGYDDNNNGVVDEPADFLAQMNPARNQYLASNAQRCENIWAGSSVGAAGLLSDLNRDGVVNGEDQFGRQELAKHLYVLMMLLKDTNYHHPILSTSTVSALDRDRITARRIAQWAVNVVDFRDRDSIMTHFEFDTEPFFNTDANPLTGTWGVDGDPATYEGPHRQVVWGCEYPDLLLTETLAFHDRRVQNRNDDDGVGQFSTFPQQNPHTDPDWDQPRIPQGSLFCELYCTANPHNPALSRDLYFFNPDTGQCELDLGRLTPIDTARPTRPDGSVNGGEPVWRLAITAVCNDERTTQPAVNNNIAHRLRTDPDRASFDPQSPYSMLDRRIAGSGLPDEQNNAQIARVVTFRRMDGTDGAKAAKRDLTDPSLDVEVYDNRGFGEIGAAQQVRLRPGHYAVVGPYRRDQRASAGFNHRTKIGFTDVTDQPPRPPAYIDLGEHSANGTILRAFHTRDVRGDNDPVYGSGAPGNLPIKIKPILGIPCGTASSDGRVVGLNVSEPATTSPNAYPIPTGTTTDPHDNIQTLDRYSPPLDKPLDEANEELVEFTTQPATSRLRRQTRLNYKTVLLQRLADPTRPWNDLPTGNAQLSNLSSSSYDPTQPLNPYITVDWMPIDLTIFNGEPPFTGAPSETGAGRDLQDISEHNGEAFRPRFGTRQRGGPREVSTITDTSVAPTNTTARFAVMPAVTPTAATTVDRLHQTVRFLRLDLWKTPDYLYVPTATSTSGDAHLETRPPRSHGFIRSTSEAQKPSDVTANKWSHPLNHTLGLLNQTYQIIRGANTAHDVRFFMTGQGWIDDTHAYVQDTLLDPAIRQQYIGSPKRPFAWLTWNNRPYINHMELLLVPASSQGRLLWEYNMRRPPDVRADNVASRYTGSGDSPPGNYSDHYTDFQGQLTLPGGGLTYLSGPPYGHLLNFFHSSATLNSSGQAPNYYRLLEYVHVPSRFSGTQKLLLGGTFQAQRLVGTVGLHVNPTAPNYVAMWPFHAPFNRVSAYREPGKININTINDAGSGVWAAVTNGASDWDYYFRHSATPRAANLFVHMHAFSTSRTSNNYRVRETAWMYDDLVASRQALDQRGPDHRWGDVSNGNFSANAANAAGRDATGSNYQMVNGVRAPFDRAHGRFYHRFDPTLPEFNSNPFRAFSATMSVPRPELRTKFNDYQDPLGTTSIGTPGHNPLLTVDSTLLRRREILGNYSDIHVDFPATGPLFARDYGSYRHYHDEWTAEDATGIPHTRANIFDGGNTDRNPAFRYQLLTKIGGNVTNRSNVYAIWAVVGFFEVDRVNMAQPGMLERYPDGYRMLRELGSDVGDIKRYRMFAIYDRSIPVGFDRGANHNVDKAILVKRFID